MSILSTDHARPHGHGWKTGSGEGGRDVMDIIVFLSLLTPYPLIFSAIASTEFCPKTAWSKSILSTDRIRLSLTARCSCLGQNILSMVRLGHNSVHETGSTGPFMTDDFRLDQFLIDERLANCVMVSA